MRSLFICLILFSVGPIISQNIEGHVYNSLNKAPLEYASIILTDTDIGAISDSLGLFKINNIKPGLYNLKISYTGFQDKILHQIEVHDNQTDYIEILLDENTKQLNIIHVSSPAFKKTAATPLSIKNISASEIQRFPGAVLDITKIIKSYPGISPKTSFGYNLVFRGGSSFENKFYLDGIEIPSINHFNVQGASGGPTSLINTDFVESIDIYSGAFPSEMYNAISGVLDIQQRDAHKDGISSRFTLGATEAGLTIESPTGTNGNMILSARKSFSEYLFKSIGLPVLPNYTDLQYRQKYKWRKHELIFIGLAAFDQSRINITQDPSESLLYNTGFIPDGDQKIYTGGINYKHYLDSGYYNLIISTNHFDNNAIKSSMTNGATLLDYSSIEQETKARFEHIFYFRSLRFKYGLNTDLHKFNVDQWSIIGTKNGLDTTDIAGSLKFNSYGAFISIARPFINNKLIISLGARTDGSSINSNTKKITNQISPRVGLSYKLNNHLSLNASYGIYYQLPPYTVLGHIEDNIFINKDSLGYIKCKQNALGLEYTNQKNYKFSLEVFDKAYDQYPFLLEDSISLANLAADYVSLGYQRANSSGQGRSGGFELMIQKKLHNKYFWMASYSYIISRFKDKNDKWVASSWDNRQFANLMFGKSLKRNWQLGLKWRYSGGTPYSPYDISNSSLIENWEVTNRGIFDYDSLNTLRLPAFHQMDIRLDKHYYFKKYYLNVYLDIQNLYRSPIAFLPYLTVQRDQQSNPIINPNDPSRYLTKIIGSDSGRMLPTIGFILQF
jgi:outer membrane receptor for ferrienterochelin and colicin